jgi:hypothetical protein
MSAKERTTGRKTGSRVTMVEDKESKDKRDRIRNAKRAEQQRVKRAKVLGLALGFTLRSMSWVLDC